MATGVNITGTSASADPGTIDEVKEAIVWVFEAAFTNHMSEQSVIEALRLLGRAAETAPGVEGTTISGCTLHGISDSFTKNGTE